MIEKLIKKLFPKFCIHRWVEIYYNPIAGYSEVRCSKCGKHKIIGNQ